MATQSNPTYNLVPHVGVSPLRFGMTIDDAVDKAREVGWSESYRRSSDNYTIVWFYVPKRITLSDGETLTIPTESADDRLGPMVYFGSNGIDLLQFAPSTNYTVLYRGTNVFDTPAKTLAAKVAKHEQSVGYDGVPIAEHSSNPLAALIFPGDIVTATDPGTDHDVWGGNKRSIFGSFGIGSKHYFASATGRAWSPPPKAAAQSGQPRYTHPKLGGATLIARHGDVLELRFDDGIVRKLKSSFVTPA